jgi:hypothetical protein
VLFDLRMTIALRGDLTLLAATLNKPAKGRRPRCVTLGPWRLKMRTVLVVDDESRFRVVAAQTLSKVDFEVLEAIEGAVHSD